MMVSQWSLVFCSMGICYLKLKMFPLTLKTISWPIYYWLITREQNSLKHWCLFSCSLLVLSLIRQKGVTNNTFHTGLSGKQVVSLWLRKQPHSYEVTLLFWVTQKSITFSLFLESGHASLDTVGFLILFLWSTPPPLLPCGCSLNMLDCDFKGVAFCLFSIATLQLPISIFSSCFSCLLNFNKTVFELQYQNSLY